MPISRLALKTAAPVVGVVGGLALLAGLGAVGAGLVALGGGVACYGATAALLRRLDRVNAALDALRTDPLARADAPAAPPRDELGRLAWNVYRTGEALQTELRELRRMEHYRREFLGDVSHELKTPIFAVQGFAETLLDGALDDERVRHTFVEKILRNTTRLAALTRDLTEIARIETGELQMKPAPFRLARAVDETLEALEPVATARGVALVRVGGEELPPALGDRERIRQVITNLVDNGVKYNRPDGRVEVTLAQAPDGRLRVAVRDTGPGIAPEHLPRLTERFYRADKHRSREVGGTGLGLAIVKHILAAHEGRLDIASTLGEGTTFSFTLPADPAR